MGVAPYTGSGKVGVTCLHCGKNSLSPHTKDNWTCGYCYSGYISMPMLSHLLTPELMEQAREPHATTPSPRFCPRCDGGMVKGRIIQGLHSVELEKCLPCNLAWFDSGKLMKLVRFGGERSIVNSHAQTHTRLQELLREALKAEQDEPEPVDETLFIPWASISLFIAFNLLAPLLSQNPGWLEQWSFSADQPFRALGLTWITSLLVHHRSQMVALLPLVFFGYYVEKRLGTKEFLKMFVAAGLASRFLYLGLGRGLPPLSGSTAGVAAVVGYGLLMIPYRDFLFPHQSYKSPMQSIQWLLVGVGGVLAVSFAYDQVNEMLARLNRGTTGPLPDDKAAARTFALHGLGLAVGLLWTVVIPPTPPKKRPLAKPDNPQ